MTASTARLVTSFAMLVCGAGLLWAAAAQGSDAAEAVRKGGTFRISFVQGPDQFDHIDPALSYTVQGWTLLDAVCARLLNYPDKAPPAGSRLIPEVAARMPRVSRDGRTYTFTLRSGFRFNNGQRVTARAFSQAIARIRALGARSPGSRYTLDIARVVAARNRLTVKLTRADPGFPARLTTPFFCAVPPSLPPDPEGVTQLPGAGPYYVAQYVRGRSVILRRNRFYRGSRPRHVDSFVVNLQASSGENVIDRIERGEADWGYVLAPVYTSRRLDERYGVNRSQFFVKPGSTLRMLAFNLSRPLFRDNPRLRRAVNFALNRRELVSATGLGPTSGRLTDQYLPRIVPGFRDARIYPLSRPDLRKARTLAQGHRRSAKAVFYVPGFPQPLALGQAAKRQLERIGLEVELRPIPHHVTNALYTGRLANPGEPWDLALVLWTPDFVDPYGYINLLLDGQFRRKTNVARFNSRAYNRRMRQAARLEGPARYRAYAKLDQELAREVAPLVAIEFLNEVTFVSRRVDPRCVVLRPRLDLAAVCLKRGA
jgi:peptide/nickel transport system substrate-binding protein